MKLCKAPDPLSFTGNISQNWKDFEDQHYWFLAETEFTEKSSEIKIGIMLSHAGKEAREVHKILPWETEGNEKKFNHLSTPPNQDKVDSLWWDHDKTSGNMYTTVHK